MVDPNIWGKHGWKFLHYVAQGYPENPTDEDKSNYKNFFLNIKNVLPCYKCQNHYKGHLTNFPITDKVLNNKESLENWVINVHNQVNLMNGKNIIDINQAKNINLPDDCIEEILPNNFQNNKINDNNNNQKKIIKEYNNKKDYNQPKNNYFIIISSIIVAIIIYFIVKNLNK